MPTHNHMPLRIEALVKRFGGVTAVDGISLEVKAGESFGLLGPNGAGKSTLIRSIVGRVRPNSGRILVYGEPAESPSARAALGWVPQELAVYPRLTSRENLAAFGRYHGLAGNELQQAIAWCLEWAALADRADEVVNRLSGGMKRRLNMAAGLIHRPRTVLMDEPTVGVDPQSRLRIFEMIEGLRREGMAVIYTTHYMEEAERLCDRIAIVDHGRIIALGTSDELIHSAFGSRREVAVRFADSGEPGAAWMEQHGGRRVNGMAHFTVEQPAEIATLLQGAARQGFEVLDVTLHRPNLESVFLHLTGRELRE
ncbi:MAG: ABC transporter ATP-binding protein [Acidobacteria bacterium]|nr:ABC transporter ATP-binding protein [Acidobacteriota bacterium]